VQFQQDFCGKRTQRTQRKGVILFFFAIFVFFCGKSLFGCILATLQCYLRKLCIFGKIFHPLFSLFSPVQILWLRLAAPSLCAFALKYIPHP
jgi:hypothetical protein